MDILICQTCGALLRSEDTRCRNCSAAVSRYSATALQVLSPDAEPMAIAHDPDPLVVERVLTLRRADIYKDAGGSGASAAASLQNMVNSACGATKTQTGAEAKDPATRMPLNQDSQKHSSSQLPMGDFFAAVPPLETGKDTALPNTGLDAHPGQIMEKRVSINLTEDEAVLPKNRALNRDSKKKNATIAGADREFEQQDNAKLPPAINKKHALIAGSICTLLMVVGFAFGVMSTQIAESVRNAPALNPGAIADLVQGKTADISGEYQVTDATPVDKSSWKMRLKQNGHSFCASGTKNGIPWRLEGEISPTNNLKFEKTYYSAGKPIGFAIEYSGLVAFNGVGKPSMHGTLSYDRKVYKFGQKIAKITGTWTALQTAPGQVFDQSEPAASSADMAGKPVPLVTGRRNLIEFIFSSDRRFQDREETSSIFMQLAALMIGVGVLIALAALKIFSPYGKLNNLAKQEYIPSQYRAQHNKMIRQWSKSFKRGAVPLGTRTEWRFWKPWVPRVLAMPPQSRANNPHMIVMGGSDKGKTRLLANMVCRDIESNDRAVVVIDSDGELSDLVTRWAAAHVRGNELAKRIIIIDPTYRGGSISYNPLEPLENINFIDAASAVVHGFKAVYTEPPGSQSQWNQQTANILRNAAILLMANNRTLVDLPTLLQDNDFRDILLEGMEKRRHERTEYATVIESWGQYKKLARTDQWITWVEPILNRVTPMLSDPRIRPILTKPAGDLRLRDLIVDKQVLLVRIPQGQLDQNANMLGSLLVTGIKQAALGISIYEPDRQNPCALYLDEMNNFIEKDTIEALTQETDKFQIGFVGCCKTLQHLPEDFRNQIIINVGTLLAFALSKKDADMIGPQMFRVDGRKIKHRTIQNFFNQVNTSPQFELISDEEKLNIDRVVGQEERHFFCYRVGSVAGTFRLKTHDFNDPPKAKIKAKLIEQMHKNQ